MTARIPELPPDVRPSRFSHMVVRTAHLAPMAAWYKSVLNAQPMFENERVCFLTYDDEHHRIMIGEDPGAPARDPASTGVMHWAYAFESIAQLVAAYERLREQGIVPKSCINHGFTTSLYYADPDGNEVELAVDNFADNESMNAWFSGGPFDRNFVGVPFDPEAMVKRHREGGDVATWHAEHYE